MKPTHTSKSLPIKVDFLTAEQLQQPGQIGLMWERRRSPSR